MKHYIKTSSGLSPLNAIYDSLTNSTVFFLLYCDQQRAMNKETIHPTFKMTQLNTP